MHATEELPLRFAGLPRRRFGDLELPIAERPLVRLLGLALLDRERAGPGLFIPRCRSVHSFGMRFPLRICFLDRRGKPLVTVASLAPRRICSCRGAESVIELVPEEDE